MRVRGYTGTYAGARNRTVFIALLTAIAETVLACCLSNPSLYTKPLSYYSSSAAPLALSRFARDSVHRLS